MTNLMTRREAINMVGEAVVDEVDGKDCDFTNRVLCDADTLVEFTACVSVVDSQGCPSHLIAYYYQEKANVDAVESLDHLDWSVSGYAVI